MANTKPLPIRFDARERERLKRYMANTSGRYLADVVRRLVFQKIESWEAMKKAQGELPPLPSEMAVPHAV